MLNNEPKGHVGSFVRWRVSIHAFYFTSCAFKPALAALKCLCIFAVAVIRLTAGKTRAPFARSCARIPLAAVCVHASVKLT